MKMSFRNSTGVILPACGIGLSGPVEVPRQGARPYSDTRGYLPPRRPRRPSRRALPFGAGGFVFRAALQAPIASNGAGASLWNVTPVQPDKILGRTVGKALSRATMRSRIPGRRFIECSETHGEAFTSSPSFSRARGGGFPDQLTDRFHLKRKAALQSGPPEIVCVSASLRFQTSNEEWFLCGKNRFANGTTRFVK